MKINLPLILVFIVQMGFSQSYKVGVLPSINYTYHLRNNWSANFKFETRPIFEDGIFGEKRTNNFYNQLMDFSGLASKKVGLRNVASAGYLIRFTEDNVIHRLTGQYSWVKKYDKFWLAQRVASDQTFIPKAPDIFRLRYRIGFQVPFKGENIDEKEYYFKLDNEFLNVWRGSEYNLEYRLSPLVGYKFNRQNKLEVGLEYRTSSLRKSLVTRHQFWLNIKWYLSSKER